jgi:hypothetical protein
VEDSRRLEDKLDKVVDSISEIQVTLASQAGDLKYHIHRTDLLEEQMKPVQSHVNELKGIVKMLKVLALLATILEGVHYFVK